MNTACEEEEDGSSGGLTDADFFPDGIFLLVSFFFFLDFLGCTKSESKESQSEDTNKKIDRLEIFSNVKIKSVLPCSSTVL